MLGTFQQSSLRIEVEASNAVIAESLLMPVHFKQWLWPQQFPQALPDRLEIGTVFLGQLGPISINHQVDFVSDVSLCLLLSQGIDGFHRWDWGNGWIQSSLQGVSLLPLSLGQTTSLLRLREYLNRRSQPSP